MANPVISVVVPTHNRAKVIPRTINSLLQQTFEDFEVVIIDDSSTDETKYVVAEFAKKDSRIKIFSTENNIGTGAAYNLGIEKSKGDYIAIMDDDDIAHPERLRQQLDVFESDPNVELVFSSIEWIDENKVIFHVSPGIVHRGAFPKDYREIFKLLYLGGGGIPNQTLMAKREIWDRFKYPVEPKGSGDWVLLMQFAASKVNIKAISSPLVQVFKGKGKSSITSGSRNKVYPQYLKAFQIINEWLESNEITEFNQYQKTALSNLYLRESRHYKGINGLSLVGKALITAPKNPQAWKEVFDYPSKMLPKVFISKKNNK